MRYALERRFPVNNQSYLESLTVHIDGDCICYLVHSDAPEAMRRMIQFYYHPTLGDFNSTTHIPLRDVLATLEAATWGEGA